ncbi:PIN domain-containing protein [Desulfonema limicola]|uniref:PIN domain-containing protein n=1 Tax=Desulfonema limicola TaxID=45656 RepID=A0A975GI15_9BACT|nr:type II toxin-antitoxin system VapC family toxin [Desulfonema limicola]QTA81358.1 PIN domain-containing protein [Desulfonema limicola]
MRILLDTSTFLWFIGGSRKLSKKAIEIIENFDNELVMSAASLWEIAIKDSIGKLELSEPFEQLIPKEINKNEIEILQIELPHLYEMMKLPLYHKDPFDRLIIAQGIIEQLPVIACDKAFKSYNIDIIW